MRKYLVTLLATLLLLVAVVSVHAEYIRQVGIEGGAARELFNTLQRTGYGGQPGLDELMICNKKTNAANMFIGYQTTLDANSGIPLEPGACLSWKAGSRTINSASIYVYVASTQNMEVSLRER